MQMHEMVYGRKRAAHSSACALGWFSIGLGLAELLAPQLVARLIGLPGREGVVRAYGMRELVTGIGILGSDRPATWVWGRVAGDALDLASLGVGMSDSASKACTIAAIGSVGGVLLADLATAQILGELEQKERTKYPDYSARSGFPRSPESMRGAGRDGQRSLAAPSMRTPPALEPLATTGASAG
jgi:hypothetical protein